MGAPTSGCGCHPHPLAALLELLGNSLEVVEVVGQVEVRDFLLEVILCPCLCDFRHWRCG